MKTLLAERKLLEILQAVLFCCAVDDGVAEDFVAGSGVEDGCFACDAVCGFGVVGVLELVVG